MSVDGLRSRARDVRNGFRALVDLAAEIEDRHAADVLDVADRLWRAAEHQSRMVAVIMWGDLAADHPELLERLRDDASADPDRRVRQLLARSFAVWCSATGWEAALPTIESWLVDPRPTVRRAATERTRDWTGRPYFKSHPQEAVRMLTPRLQDPDDDVRYAAENALREVLRRHPELA
jgi:hypothetical protein